jgi:hypothetical protein
LLLRCSSGASGGEEGRCQQKDCFHFRGWCAEDWMTSEDFGRCCVRPNVRAKPGPAGRRQARAVENVARHRPGLVACRWGSA